MNTLSKFEMGVITWIHNEIFMKAGSILIAKGLTDKERIRKELERELNKGKIINLPIVGDVLLTQSDVDALLSFIE